jgi:NAD(P)-dependent dehydrogenase (short-subunit alcohol dehydrogenase family)
VVTGAAGDVGAMLAARLAGDGWQVVAADIREPEGGPGIDTVVADVADPAAVEALAERAASAGDLALWVNAAGIFRVCPVAEASDEDWHRILSVNLTGTFNGCRAALPRLVSGGRIVNLSSIAGQTGVTGVHPAYGASKAGVQSLTAVYAKEGAKHGITCAAVAPGVLDSAMGGQFTEDQRAKLEASTAFRRFGRVEEVVEAILFLADTERSGWINGATIPVNGGAWTPY